MKSVLYLLFIISVVSCQTKGEKSKTTTTAKVGVEKLQLKTASNSTLAEWVEYYQLTNPQFKLSDFEKKETVALSYEKGDVFGTFDKEFDPLYEAFFVYSLSMNKYIDFDSYSWFVDENGDYGAEPDQSINLVDLKKKTVQRIGFRGPSQWVEDAFWKTEYVVILLENTDENQPVITEIDFENNKVTHYSYPGKLKGTTQYSQKRFERKSKHTE